MIELVLYIALVGVIVWFILTYVPMPEPFKQVIIVIVVIFLILYLIRVLGISGPPLPRAP